MRSAWIAVLLAAPAVAGCAGGTASYELRDTFTENATQEQRDELQREVEDRGGAVAFLESFPVQFDATDLGDAGCEEVRAFAQDADYVAEVGDCEAEASGESYAST